MPPGRAERPSLRLLAGLFTRCHRPAGVVDVEDDAVRVLELPLESLVALLAEVEEKFAARRLDRSLLRPEIIGLEAKMMQADEGVWILEAGADLALVLQQREIDLAVAHVDAARGRALGHFRAAEPQRFLIEVRGLLEVLDHEGDVPDSCHGVSCSSEV